MLYINVLSFFNFFAKKTMKDNTTARSINIIYWLTRTGRWIILVCIFTTLLFEILSMTGCIKAKTFGLDLPFSFSLKEQGTMILYDNIMPLKLTHCTAHLETNNTPDEIYLIFGLILIIWQLIGLFIINHLYKLISNVKRQDVFNIRNTFHLRMMALGSGFFWLFTQFYSRALYVWLRDKIHLNSIDIQSSTNIFNFSISIALILWALSYIFEEGNRIHEEQQLTV